MAKKKKNTEARERRDLTKFCAFWSLAISALLYIVSGVMRFVMWLVKNPPNLGGVCGVLQFLANIALVIAVALPAYSYVRGRSRGWKVLYFVSLAIFALGIVFGLLPNF